MVIGQGDYRIYAQTVETDGNCIYLVCAILAQNYIWPKLIPVYGKIYIFKSNEVTKDCVPGSYGSYAKYIEKTPG